MMDKLVINDLTINNLSPIKKKFKNKNNKFSAKGYIGAKRVKIYEVFDENQGNLMKFISKNKELSQYFPKLITYDKKFIVEEWVNGKTLKELNYSFKKKNPQSDEVKHIINLMWSLKYDNIVFDYLKYIHTRIDKTYNLNLNYLPIRVNHNDLSLDNIIVSSHGLKIIDNEFLGCNNGWILNIKNSFLKEDFIYQNYIPTKTLNVLWNTRREWSKIKLKNSKSKKRIFKNLIKNLIKKII